MKMKAVFKARPEVGGLEMREIEVPKPKPGEALVKMKVTAICGTDLHIYNWDAWSQRRVKVPRILGHEFAGEIVDAGPGGLRYFKVGDYVSGEGHVACGFCRMCRTGQGHICEDWKGLGYDMDGCFCEYLAYPEGNLVRNRPDLEPAVAAIQDPLGNAVHTVFAADCVAAKVAVFGCGPVGLLAIAVLKAIGAAQIIALGRSNEYRLKMAKEAGAHVVLKTSAVKDVPAEIRRITGEKGVDVAIEIAGSKDAIRDAIKSVRPGGTVVYLGIPSEPIEFDVAQDIVFNATTIKGITGRRMYDTWYRMAGLLQSGQLDAKRIITHTFPFDQFQKGFDLMKSGNCGKVVLDL